jgi:hypothetical protein
MDATLAIIVVVETWTRVTHTGGPSKNGGLLARRFESRRRLASVV